MMMKILSTIIMVLMALYAITGLVTVIASQYAYEELGDHGKRLMLRLMFESFGVIVGSVIVIITIWLS